MTSINLLPWRDELKEQRKKQFIAICILSALLGLALAAAAWFFYDQKLQDQQQANTIVQTANADLDGRLKSLDGLETRKNAIIERMKLIQGLQGQRPVPVHLLDELVRVTPSTMYFTKMTRVGDKFTIEGKAENPNVVAELLRNLEASVWYRNAFMESFIAVEEQKAAQGNTEKTAQVVSVVPRVEENYGSFVITANLDELVDLATAENGQPASGAAITASSQPVTGATP